jgi:hypothetical protein
MEKYYCECGCGNEVSIYHGKPRRFLPYHHMKTEEYRKKDSERMMGNTLFEGLSHSEKTKKEMSKRQMGEGNSGWNGGRTISAGGYVSILKPEHPFADVNGRIKEERLVMETFLGRYLKKEEIVHHINHNKQDNRPENLQIVSSLEHGKIHHTGNQHALGYKFTKEQSDNLSKAKKGHLVSEETRNKISIKTRGRKHTKEECEKISIARKGKKDTEQTRKNKSVSAKKGWEKRRGKC